MDSFNVLAVRCFKTFLVLQLVLTSSAFAQAGGKLFGEAELLAVAKKYQDATEFHRQHPSVAE